MTEASKHGKTAGNGDHGSYERRDLQPSGIIYFLLTLVVATVLSLFGLRGLYVYLDHREKADQPQVNPLLTNVPADTRHVAHGYPQNAFPNPKLEEDERGQLYDIRMNEENTLYTYGWVDEKAGTVHIPIERAMDLIVQRGLPVRSQAGASGATGMTPKFEKKESTGKESSKLAADQEGVKK